VKISTFGTIIVLLVIILAPCINATLLEGKTINEESSDYGRVSGDVVVHCFPPPTYIVGAKLVLEGGNFKRTTFSGLLGNYRFNFVPVGRQYTLTVTHPKFKTVTETFALSADDPNLKIGITMMDKDNAKTVEVNSKTITISSDRPIYTLGITMKDKDESKTKSEEPACLGSIHGGVIRFYGGGWQDPIPFAKIDIGIRKTRANRFGQYRINFLPVNRTYTVTASAKGYQSETREITLTAEKPDGTVHFSLKESDVSIPKSKITENTNEPACLGSIYGNAGTSHGWGFTAVFFCKNYSWR